MVYKYEKRKLKSCPSCKEDFIPKSGKQVTCGRSCARVFSWTKRKPKDVIKAPNGYLWKYVENHPFAIKLHKNMRPHGGYMLEHRYLMEQKLGRHLSPRERVHHKNGIRNDNRIENLELWTLDHKDPPGVRVSDITDSTWVCGLLLAA